MSGLELVEEYTAVDERRYRFLVKGRRIVINVSAGSLDEAWEKAKRIARSLGLLED